MKPVAFQGKGVIRFPESTSSPGKPPLTRVDVHLSQVPLSRSGEFEYEDVNAPSICHQPLRTLLVVIAKNLKPSMGTGEVRTHQPFCSFLTGHRGSGIENQGPRFKNQDSRKKDQVQGYGGKRFHLKKRNSLVALFW